MTILMVPGGEYYPSLGPQLWDFIEENLIFGPGDLRGQPANLDDEKRALIYRMYEVFPQGHKEAGRRRFQRVGICLAKGLAKTELAAWIAACELHPDAPVRFNGFNKDGTLRQGRGVTDPYIPMVAYTEEQSDELAYGTLKFILEEGPLKDDFDTGLERIMRRRGDGKAVSLSSSPNARDGARTTFSVMDETHWFTLPRLKQAKNTMLMNLPKRIASDSWNLEITTAHEPGAGSVAEETYQYAMSIYEGKRENARLFYFLRSASDDHDLTTEAGARAAVIEASGPAISWRNIEGIMELWRDPTTDLAYWERVYCNRLVKSSAKAFDVVQWKNLAKPDYTIPDGALVTLGFDGSVFNDATGIVATEVEIGHQQLIAAWERPHNAPDNWQVPEDEVDSAVAGCFERWNIWRMYADPPYWQTWVAKWSGQFGAEKVIEWWTNRRVPMTRAIESYQTAIMTSGLSHDGNEVLARHIANAHKHNLPQRDEQGRPLFLIRKERSDSPFKIDLAMAGILSWEARQDAIAAGVTEGEKVITGDSFWL